MEVKTIRQCHFPNCKTNIDKLPPKHTYCTKHQIAFNVIIERLEIWFPLDQFEDVDYVFLFVHQKGCNASELSRHLDGLISTREIAYALNKKRYKDNRSSTKHEWCIDLLSQSEIIVLARHFETIAQAAKKIGVRRQTMLTFATDGQERFGEVKHGISGRNVIRKQSSADLKAAFDLAMKETIKRRYKNIRSVFYGPKECSAFEFGKVMGVSDVNVRYWIRRGFLSADLLKGKNAISLSARWEFIIKGVEGKIPVRGKVARRCKELINLRKQRQKTAA